MEAQALTELSMPHGHCNTILIFRFRLIFEMLKYNREKYQIIRELELLIIDEISMVRCDVLDAIEYILRVYRDKPYLPFGGVQVLMLGDPFQLPPVMKREEQAILGEYYKTSYFFSSNV